MKERETLHVSDVAAAYATAYSVATAASAREFLQERGMEALEYRVDRLLSYLHRRYGWRTGRSLWKAVLHRAPKSTTEDCLKFCTKRCIPLRPVEGESWRSSTRGLSRQSGPRHTRASRIYWITSSAPRRNAAS